MLNKMVSKTLTLGLGTLLVLSNSALILAADTINATDSLGAEAAPSVQITCSQAIDQKLAGATNNFFNALKAKDTKTAYVTYTTKGFKKNVTQAEFNEIMEASGLANYTAREWYYINIPQEDMLTLTGDFTLSNGVVMPLRLDFKKGSDLWKLDTVYQIPNVSFLKKLMPTTDTLKDMIKKEIDDMIVAQAKRNFTQYYRRFAKSAHSKVTVADVKKVLAFLKVQKLDITLANKDLITFDPCSPTVNTEGTMVTSGTYKNNGFTVGFVFEYTNEWTWKLSGFNVNANPIKKTESK